MSNSTRRRHLRLRHVSFERVELDVVGEDLVRPVTVRVSSGSSWREAVRFPCIGSDATESTREAELDEAIRERAAEELVRLEAAALAIGASRAA